jgi:hypothetical protein
MPFITAKNVANFTSCVLNNNTTLPEPILVHPPTHHRLSNITLIILPTTAAKALMVSLVFF